MATLSRRRVPKEPFQIHEDAPDTMSDTNVDSGESATQEQVRINSQSHTHNVQEVEPIDEDVERGNQEEEEEHDQSPEEDCDSDSSDENDPIDLTVQQDMEKLTQAFPDFREDYRLLKRIGEGTATPRNHGEAPR